jgi:hypothetical protein
VVDKGSAKTVTSPGSHGNVFPDNDVSAENPKSASLKSKAVHEIVEMFWVAAYFGLFFFAFATYKMLLLHQFRSARFIYVTALINTLVLAKVVLLGGFVPQGKLMEHRPLLISAIYKAGFYAILVAVFHFIEEMVKDVFRDHNLIDAFQQTLRETWIQLAGLTVICFCLFIPFFALWEVRRLMGEKAFTELFIRRKAISITVSH